MFDSNFGVIPFGHTNNFFPMKDLLSKKSKFNLCSNNNNNNKFY